MKTLSNPLSTWRHVFKGALAFVLFTSVGLILPKQMHASAPPYVWSECADDGGTCTSVGMVIYGDPTTGVFTAPLFIENDDVSCDATTFSAHSSINASNSKCYTKTTYHSREPYYGDSAPVCAAQGDLCDFIGTATISYGDPNSTTSQVYASKSGSFTCTGSAFGVTSLAGASCFWVTPSPAQAPAGFIPCGTTNPCNFYYDGDVMRGSLEENAYFFRYEGAPECGEAEFYDTPVPNSTYTQYCFYRLQEDQNAALNTMQEQNRQRGIYDARLYNPFSKQDKIPFSSNSNVVSISRLLNDLTFSRVSTAQEQIMRQTFTARTLPRMHYIAPIKSHMRQTVTKSTSISE